MSVEPAARVERAWLLAWIVLLGAAIVWFLYGRVHYIASFSPASYSPYFWPRRFGLLAHITGGAIAITTGLAQIWLGLNGRTRGAHRWLGKVYAAAIVLGSAGGVYMAVTIPGSPAYASGLFFLALAWLVTTGMALYAISLRRIDQHRDWMLRSYTVTFAFVTFRLSETIIRAWLKLPESAGADQLDTLMAWACWALPLLFIEPFIQLRYMKRRTA